MPKRFIPSLTEHCWFAAKPADNLLLSGKTCCIKSNALPGGYHEVTLETENNLPSLGPGQYINIDSAFAGAVIRTFDRYRFQILLQAAQSPQAGTALTDITVVGTHLIADAAHPYVVLVSEDAAIASSLFAAAQLKEQQHFRLTAFAQFENTPPFIAQPSHILMPGCPAGVIAAAPLFDNWNIASRLASNAAKAGFYHGEAWELITLWLQKQPEKSRQHMQILGFGSENFIARLTNWSKLQAITLQTAIIP